MPITCFIRCERKPRSRIASTNGRASFPVGGGHLLGYSVPHEGHNYEAWGDFLTRWLMRGWPAVEFR